MTRHQKHVHSLRNVTVAKKIEQWPECQLYKELHIAQSVRTRWIMFLFGELFICHSVPRQFFADDCEGGVRSSRKRKRLNTSDCDSVQSLCSLLSMTVRRLVPMKGLRQVTSARGWRTVWDFKMGGKTATKKQGLEIYEWLKTNMARDHPNQWRPL